MAPLDLSSLPEVDAEAIAVCLLFSFRDPTHELAVAAELRRRHPDAVVVASYEVAPEFREYERASTAAVDAYLGPLTRRYLTALGTSAADAGLPAPLVMRSSGGVASIEEAAAHPALILLSGPAAGVVAAGRIAASSGVQNAIAFDMGGTSTDVCLIAGGRAGRSEGRDVAGLPIRVPMVDVHTVGAGGGSVAWRDRGGALLVGPRSAGADSRAGMLRPGRRGSDRDRRQPAARPASRAAPGRARARPRRGRARAGGARPGRHRRRGQRRDAASVAGRLGRAGPRPAGLRARRLRRRRPVARVRARRRARLRESARARRGGRALGARARRERRAPRRGPVVRGPAGGGRRAAGRGRGEPAVPRAVVRAHGRSGPGARRALPPRTRGSLRLRRPRAAGRARRPSGPPPSSRARHSGSRAAGGGVTPGRQLVELHGATCWIADGWVGETDASGTLVLERCA